jgi:hypothetical protein
MVSSVYTTGIAITYVIGCLLLLAWIVYRAQRYLTEQLLKDYPEPDNLFSQLGISPVFHNGKLNLEMQHPLLAMIDLAVYSLLVFAISCTWIISVPGIIIYIIIYKRKHNGKLSRSNQTDS